MSDPKPPDPLPASATDLPVAILAGGLATRLGAATGKQPKLLLEVAGEPFFSHQIRLLRAAGLTRLVVCAGHLGDRIVERYGDGSDAGIQIQYSFDGSQLLGTGGALVRALPKLGDAFYVLYGDSYLPVDYRAVGASFLRSGRLGLMTVFENRDRHDSSNVWFENGEIRIYDKRHRDSRMRHIDYGLGVYRRAAFASFRAGEVLDLSVIQQALLARGELAACEVFERFYEIGSAAGLAELDQLLRRGAL